MRELIIKFVYDEKTQVGTASVVLDGKESKQGTKKITPEEADLFFQSCVETFPMPGDEGDLL